ncbi:hypothetical protein [Glacieibacterium frigidum]|uniref:N-acetyltransferase domain-containing protein n=1 Tax=Glacieibacterium frigidum TaxID=2593303 RepID=A0A552UG54_9SPHN|nr:hypothetical protein [Glacieibacterium frigidum]TRW17194.1 hypothetical protein FMM06_03060 [Glacieibacterium frigidum]
MTTGLTMRPLDAGDVAIIRDLIDAQPEEYLRFFHAFGSDAAATAALLAATRRDVYSGLFWGGALICIVSLRGWDEGYDIPAFGLAVSAAFRGREVLDVAMASARLTSRLAGATRMMCKVHPANAAAVRGAAKMGFTASHAEAGTGNIVYYLDL